jgi:hypothetical protein
MSKRRKIVLWVFGSLVVLVLAAYLYLIPFGGVETIIESEVNSILPDTLGLSVDIGDISGNPFSGMTLKNVSVAVASILPFEHSEQ